MRRYKKIVKKAYIIYEKYNLQYSFKTDEEIRKIIHDNFIFHDQDSNIVISNKNYDNIYIHTDKKQKVNLISYNKKSTDDKTILNFLKDLKGMITYFIGGIGLLVNNYYRRLEEERRENDGREITIEKAISSVCNDLGIGKEYIGWLTECILSRNLPYKKKEKISEGNYSNFYECGFSYYGLLDDPEHSLNTEMMMYQFSDTPERILAAIANKAMVIGLSATATINTPINNYQLSYLKEKLKDNYLKLPENLLDSLKNDYSKTQEGFKDIQIHKSLIGTTEDYWNNLEETIFDEIIDNEEYAQAIYYKICDATNKMYEKLRYYRLVEVFKEFLIHNDIQSLLCMLTTIPCENGLIDESVLKDLFLYVCWDTPGFENVEESSEFYEIISGSGEKFDEKKRLISNKLHAGKKLFVITSFQTMSTGMNFTYEIPDETYTDIIHVNRTRNKDNFKDFDAMYIDKPTHIITNLSEMNNEFSKAIAIYEINYLKEVGEISINEARKRIQKVFGNNIGSYVNSGTDIYNLESIKSAALIIVLQALGRMDRTTVKSKDIYIFLDENIKNSISFNIKDCDLISTIGETTLDYLQRKVKTSDDEVITTCETLANKAVLSTARISNWVLWKLENPWTEQSMQEWNEYRETLLKYPEGEKLPYKIDKPNKDTIVYSNFNENPDGKINKIMVNFNSSENTPFPITAKAAKLPLFMKNPTIKKWFEQHEYATEWKPSLTSMTYVDFQNIYKGALGEAVGECVFNEVLHIGLEQIINPQHFEKFDFKLVDRNIFLDMKNYHESTLFDRTTMLQNIANKAIAVGTKCVLVINAIAEKEYEIMDTYKDGVHIIEIPSLLNGDNAEFNQKALDKIISIVNSYIEE